MKSYLDIVQMVLDQGQTKATRTGIDAHAIAGAMFEHEMSDGYPLLTTKKVPFRLISTELEFFIKGITDKQWLIDRNNHIWDEWANPQKVPYAHDEETKKRMTEERDLGAIYGYQWRNFDGEYVDHATCSLNKGIDQLKIVVDRLKTDPHDRRMIVMAWNPNMLHKMALPPCHYGFQVTVLNNKLNLLWLQRSVDTMLGLPFNIASYALLLHLLAKEAKLEEGKLVGFLGDVHIYANHVDGAKEQLARDSNQYQLPKIETENFTSIFDWAATDSKIINYQSHPRIKFEIAV